MKLAKTLAVAFYLVIGLFAMYYGSKVLVGEPRLPCGVAEISPDFNHAEREQCRKSGRHRL